jgi:hypothetical protein
MMEARRAPRRGLRREAMPLEERPASQDLRVEDKGFCLQPEMVRSSSEAVFK